MKVDRQKYLQEEVAQWGFTQHSHSGDRQMFDFVTHDAIHLTIYPKLKQAELSYIYKLFKITTGKFSWPHIYFYNTFMWPLQQIVNRLTL